MRADKAKSGILLLVLATLPAIAQANGLMRIESNTLGSMRTNYSNHSELPFYEMAAAAYSNEKKDTEVNLNFSLFSDPTTVGTTQAKLYLLDAKFSPVPDRVSVHVGRTLDSQHTVGINSVDLISTDVFFLQKQLSVGAFYGLERRIEAIDDISAARVWGADAHFHSNDVLPYYLTAKFEQRHNTDDSEPLENRVQLSAQKGINWGWSPELIADTVTNLSGKNLERLEGGVNLYPGPQTLVRLRELSYDVLPNTGPEQPLFTIFASGRLYETRAQVETKLTRIWTLSLTGYRDQFWIQPNVLATGYGAEGENRLRLGGLNLGHTIYIFHSYGGDVLGNRISIRQATFKNHEIYGAVDYARYSKITSSNRPTLNTELGWTSLLGKTFKFSLGAEINSNDISRYDIRAISKLVYVFWDET